jgi:predicted nucleotidyltransferase
MLSRLVMLWMIAFDVYECVSVCSGAMHINGVIITSFVMYTPAMTILDIGSSLASARRAAGLSQRELAQRLGTSQQQIARWEATGYRSASLARVAAAGEALGVTAPSALANLPLAAETLAAYSTAPAAQASETPTTLPARDLGEIASRVRAHAGELREYGLSRIGVFGSFALGEQTPDSDVDLLVEFSAKPEGFAYMEPPAFAEEILGRAVDWVEPQLLRPRLRDRVLREVVYVWEA